MKVTIAGFAALVFVLCAPQAATAGLSATIVDSTGDPYSVVAVAGTTFNVRVSLAPDISLSALQLKLQETTSPLSGGIFKLDSVSFNSVKWAVPGPGGDDYRVIPPLGQTLNPTSGLIGDLAADGDAGTGTGTFDFATLGIKLSRSAASGDYYLNLAEIVYGDTNFNDYVDATTGAPYLVQVQAIPAPGAAVLGMIGLSTVGCARRWVARRCKADRKQSTSERGEEIRTGSRTAAL